MLYLLLFEIEDAVPISLYYIFLSAFCFLPEYWAFYSSEIIKIKKD